MKKLIEIFSYKSNVPVVWTGKKYLNDTLKGPTCDCNFNAYWKKHEIVASVMFNHFCGQAMVVTPSTDVLSYTPTIPFQAPPLATRRCFALILRTIAGRTFKCTPLNFLRRFVVLPVATPTTLVTLQMFHAVDSGLVCSAHCKHHFRFSTLFDRAASSRQSDLRLSDVSWSHLAREPVPTARHIVDTLVELTTDESWSTSIRSISNSLSTFFTCGYIKSEASAAARSGGVIIPPFTWRSNIAITPYTFLAFKDAWCRHNSDDPVDLAPNKHNPGNCLAQLLTPSATLPCFVIAASIHLVKEALVVYVVKAALTQISSGLHPLRCIVRTSLTHASVCASLCNVLPFLVVNRMVGWMHICDGEYTSPRGIDQPVSRRQSRTKEM